MLHIVSENSSEDSFNQRAGIFLLNSLACQVDGEQKVLVGSLGAVEKMLQIISEKLEQGHCDDVMETAWSTMWNVTDETPLNCERFLAAGGMFLFLKCKVSHCGGWRITAIISPSVMFRGGSRTRPTSCET